MTSQKFKNTQKFLSLDLYPNSWQTRVVHYQRHMYILDHQPLIDRTSDTNVFLLQYSTLKRAQLRSRSSNSLRKFLTDTTCLPYILFVCTAFWSLIHIIFCSFLELHYNRSWRVFTPVTKGAQELKIGHLISCLYLNING